MNQPTVKPSHPGDAMNSWIPAPSNEGQKSDFPSSLTEVASSNLDPLEVYFECITTCSLDDGECITSCTEVLRESH
jgi:hypothetical protein